MNLNGRTINPGELRTPVLLAPRTVTTAGGFQRARAGYHAPGYGLGEVAKRARLRGLAAQAAGANQPATVLIRYNASLDATWYVSNDNGRKWYEMVSSG